MALAFRSTVLALAISLASWPAGVGAQEPIARPPERPPRPSVDLEDPGATRTERRVAPRTAGSSLRSTELVRRDCHSTLGREEVTLFANGTVRLRSGPPDDLGLWLHELETEETEAYLNRFREIDLSESPQELQTVAGAWIESCELALGLPEDDARRFHYGRYDSLTLALRRVVSIVEDLLAEVDRERAPEGAQQLPADYLPEVGDRLRRTDGAVFEIIGRTADQQGIELQGVQVPLALYVPLSELRRWFVSVETRER